MFCLLYSPKQKNCINTKSHVIDIFTSEDMENISLCIFQYLTLYYIIITITVTQLFVVQHFKKSMICLLFSRVAILWKYT
jgi:hypothetical protein